VFKAEPLELAYLSWGNRWYGDAPANARAHDGWHYFVVLSGTPLLHANGRTFPTRPGLVSVADPECVVGHSDRPGAKCDILTWVWRTPPVTPGLQPAPGESLRFMLDRASLRRLKALHGGCREEVDRTNERSRLRLRIARAQLDLILLDRKETADTRNGSFRLQLAIDFLRDHLHDPEPVKLLAEYLHLSETSLQRLFRSQTGKTPREFALQWRMNWAREQLAKPDASVKSVAYTLGYRHANDFSRAFKWHFGHRASIVQTRPGTPQRDITHPAGRLAPGDGA
jgi:AraC-like DNA-binding protein